MAVNSTLRRIWKHDAVKCDHCKEKETLGHLMIISDKYYNERM